MLRIGKTKARAPRRDLGRLAAMVLCVVFGVVGAIPLGLGLLVRTSAVRDWAARETAALIAREVGVTARYRVEVQAWPLLIALNDLAVDASDGRGPFLSVERATVRPRPFSLLAGKLDVGDVEVIGPRIRAVVEHGELKNLVYKLPPSSPKAQASTKPEIPVASIAVTDAHVDLSVDDAHVVASSLDVDVTGEDGGFEIAVRAGTTTVVRVHPFVGREAFEDAVDEDVICRLDARVRVDEKEILLRRLAISGSVDFDPDPGTAPSCRLEPGDWRAVELHLGATRLVLPTEGRKLAVRGRVQAKLPVGIAHRFASLAHATGSIGLDLDAEFEEGAKLPRIEGTLSADTPGIDGKVFAHRLTANVSTASGAIELSKVEAAWADGKVTIARAKVDPFAEGMPLTAGPIDIQSLEFHALLRDLGAHPRAHVAWSIEKAHFDKFGGKLSPVALEGVISAQTKGFEVFNKPVIDPTRSHMVGIKEGTVRGTFKVTPSAVVLQGMSVDTPRSHLSTTVSIAFKSYIDIEVPEGKVELGDFSPLIEIPVSGLVSLHAGVHGPFEHPKIEGEIGIAGFNFGGFPVGDVEYAKVAFVPLVLELEGARIKHGQSRIKSPLTRIAFDKGADVLVDADVDTRESPSLTLHDFFEVFHFEKDPRFADMSGLTKGRARIHYALGGKEDHCGGGFLDVRAKADLEKVFLFGEHYDDGALDMDFLWDDQAAGASGMRVDLHSAQLRKGAGSIVANATVTHGGSVRGNAIATGVPLGRLEMLGPAGKLLDGSMSMVADLGGTLSDFEATADVNLSRVRVGPSTLPPSRLRMTMEAAPSPKKSSPKTRCMNERATAFDPVEFEKDASAGVFRLQGQLFDGQIGVRDVTITRQKHKVLKGGVSFKALDLGTLSNMLPGVAFAGQAPRGNLTATLDVKSLPFDSPKNGDMTLKLDALSVERDRNSVTLLEQRGPIRLANDELVVPDLRLQAKSASGLSVALLAGGKIHGVTSSPDLDLDVRIEPIDLARISSELASVERAAGTLDATLRVAGPPGALRTSGAAHLRKGELILKGSPLALTEANADIEVGGGDARIKNATLSVGGGTVEIGGRMPLQGADVGALTATIVARNVKLPIAEGINLTTDADLEASYRPLATPPEGERNLPEVKGTVSLTSFSYTRPIALSLSLGAIGRPQRTSVATYDPADDAVRFRLNVVSPRPLRFSNNLVDMQLEVVDPGLVLSGTNQKYGAQGILRILPDSKLTLRNNEFDVREGTVRFDDPSRIAPKVDLRAQTEYRRYAAAQETTTGTTPGDPGSASSSAAGAGTANTTNNSGLWRVTLRAHGDADDLRVSLTSDPPLGQEDIVLLLTVGMTRAEVDRSAASNLGTTVGLEALSALTGADKAVRSVVPIIDEFRPGTGYSSKSARMEPTVTIGKRLSEDVRATVTTGITENREVRSNVEWKLNRRLSVQGSYDNANDVSSSALGNIGADIRWRLEFE